MITSTILLTSDNFYVNENGELPSRPPHDKQLLATLCKDQSVSQKAYDMLPPSIREVVKVTELEPTIGITIPEIDALTDLLIVSRSNELIVRGKKFDLERSFKLLIKDRKIELWGRV